MKPIEIKQAVAHLFDGEISYLNVIEDDLGLWVVRSRVQPRDKRRRAVDIFGEAADTREEAVASFLDAAQNFWPQHDNLVPVDKGTRR